MVNQATILNVQVGTRLIADGGFTCLPNAAEIVVEDEGRGLFVPCGCGKHYLDGQLDDGDAYIGFAVAR
jgi:hypothetical protein